MTVAILAYPISLAGPRGASLAAPSVGFPDAPEPTWRRNRIPELPRNQFHFLEHFPEATRMFGLADLTMDDCLPAEPAHLPIPTPLIPLREPSFFRWGGFSRKGAKTQRCVDLKSSGLTPGLGSSTPRRMHGTDSSGQLGKALKRFEVRTGAVEYGWCEFSVRLGDDSWSCNASYLGHHPLNPLIHSAVDLYNHIFEDPIPIENAIWDSNVDDEPGGIVIRATPEGECVRVRIYCYDGMDSIWPDPTTLPEIPPTAEGLVDYWAYADAIIEDGSRAIARHGITGLRNAWQTNRWDIDAHFEVLPVEHFLYLAALVKYRSPKAGMSLEEELVLLHEIRAKCNPI